MIEFNKFLELNKKGYTLDVIYLLKNLDKLPDFSEEYPKISILRQNLLRRGLISEEGKITIEGSELLKFTEEVSEKKIIRKPKDDSFDKWWSKYPGTDTFEHKNKKFQGTRALKVKKEDCKIKINKILNEGDYTIDLLIKALELEVEQKKEHSVKTGQNKLSYMQNSLTYLNQRTFEPYIDLIKAGHKEEIKTTVFNGIEI